MSRPGKVVGVRGDPDNPDSRGFLCIRGQASHEILDNERRVLYPMMRHRAGMPGGARRGTKRSTPSPCTRAPPGWQASRAIACPPALTGQLGIAGGGLGPRHGTGTHFTSIAEDRRRPARRALTCRTRCRASPRRWATGPFGAAARRHRYDVVVRRCGPGQRGLARLDLVVSFDLFMNETARRFADIVVPGTAWVEELGAKATNTHVYLMPKVVEPPGECRSPMWVLRQLARRTGLDGFFPWVDDSGPLDAILDHPRTRHVTVAELVAEGGMRRLDMSHVVCHGEEGHGEGSRRRSVLMCPALPGRRVTLWRSDGTHPGAVLKLLRGEHNDCIFWSRR